jgi:hypothetical protein
MKLSEKYELKTVAYHPELRVITGSITAALLMQQLLYWWSRKTGTHVYKTVAEMTDETGLTRHEQKGACDKLVTLGFITLEYRGTHKVRHFQVNVDAIYKALDQQVKSRCSHAESEKRRTSWTESGDDVRRNSADISAEFRPAITEITSEITSETLSGSVKHSEHCETKKEERENQNRSCQKPTVFKAALPEWLDAKLWDVWLDARQVKFGLMTQAAIDLALSELNELVGQGWPADMVLREAIARGTPRFYPPCKPGEEGERLANLKRQRQSVKNVPHKDADVPVVRELRQEIQWLVQSLEREGNTANFEAFEGQLALARRRLGELMPAEG